MATVILLRHGRTTANAAGTLAGRTEVDLDETGVAQAEAAGARLRGVTLAAVVSSPLLRCRRTVKLALPGVEVTVDDRLTECGYGDWEGRRLEDLAEDPLWWRVQTHPSAVRFPGAAGESMAQAAARAVAAVRDWDARVGERHGDQAVWLACTHGDLVKAVVADALGLHLDLFQRIVVEPGSLTVVRYTPARPYLLRLSDTGDLRLPDWSATELAVGGGSGAHGTPAGPATDGKVET